MKKLSLIIAALAGLYGANALAENQTVSLGYAQSKVEDFQHIRGVNLQYRYEFDTAWSVLGSFTYMQGDQKDEYNDATDYIRNEVDAKYYSLMAGPAFRINQYVSLYALGGVAYLKTDGNTHWENGDNTVYNEDISDHSTSFAYGAGVIVNPTENLSVNVGYEGTKADFGYGSFAINGFNVGVGYRF